MSDKKKSSNGDYYVTRSLTGKMVVKKKKEAAQKKAPIKKNAPEKKREQLRSSRMPKPIKKPLAPDLYGDEIEDEDFEYGAYEKEEVRPKKKQVSKTPISARAVKSAAREVKTSSRNAKRPFGAAKNPISTVKKPIHTQQKAQTNSYHTQRKQQELLWEKEMRELNQMMQKTVPQEQEEPQRQKQNRPKQNRNAKKMSAPKKVLMVITVVVLLLAIGVMVFANAMLGNVNRKKITGDSNLTYQEILGDEYETTAMEDSTEEILAAQQDVKEHETDAVETYKGVDNILLIGADSLEEGGGNSDSVIIATINYNTQKIHLTSLEREMYVKIPGGSTQDWLTGADGNAWGMLNATLAWGGPDLLVQTVEDTFKINIDHYVVVDFTGFKDVIDQIGGVTLNLTEEEAQYINDWFPYTANFAEGEQILAGDYALVYARTRYIDNDMSRTNRQRNVIEAAISKVSTLSISELMSLAKTVLSMVTTDMSNTEMMAYVSKALTLFKYPIDQLLLPVELQDGDASDCVMYVGSLELFQVNLDVNIPALRKFINS